MILSILISCEIGFKVYLKAWKYCIIFLCFQSEIVMKFTEFTGFNMASKSWIYNSQEFCKMSRDLLEFDFGNIGQHEIPCKAGSQ